MNNSLLEKYYMRKKPLKKQNQSKEQQVRKMRYSKRRERYNAFGFLIGEY